MEEDRESRPRVFLCHASEDSDRFARGLAERLGERGLDVWFDEWELLPGDSLVDKIFEEGLKQAEAMLIVLSANSVDKPWVREEINAAFLKRIEGKCKLIPVLIDEVDIPEVLKTTVYQRVEGLGNYEAELDRIVRAIIGDRTRRDPGDLPGYAATPALPGLHSTDTRVLRAAGDLAIATDQELVSSEDVLQAVTADGVGEDALLESLQVLEEHGFVEVVHTMASGIAGMSAFTITLLGLEEYASAFVPGYEELVRGVVATLVNSPDQTSDGAISGSLGASRLLVEHILDGLALQGLIRVSKLTGPTTLVYGISPQLQRILNERG